MARFIHEIMNRELLAFRPIDTAGEAVDGITGMGVSSAPVIDAHWHPVGVVSLRDLVGAPRGERVEHVMSAPALTCRRDEGVHEVARRMAEQSLHHLVVVDAKGHAVGVVSALDALRGVLGLPSHHPQAFPHMDRHGLTWSDDAPLVSEAAEGAPDAAGVLVVSRGDAGVPERTVWAEATHNLRTRVLDILSTPQHDKPALAMWLERGVPLRFRTAAVENEALRTRVASELIEAGGHLPRPAGTR